MALLIFTLWEILRFSTVFQLANITKITLYSPIKTQKKEKASGCTHKGGFACFLPLNSFNFFMRLLFYRIGVVNWLCIYGLTIEI